MKRVVKYSLIIFGLISLYSISWYFLSWRLCKELEKYSPEVKINLISTEVKYSFQKAVPYGFPFKIGAKIIGLHEDARAYHTSHDGIITLGYDLIKQGIFLKNSGQSISHVKPFESGFGSIVNVDSSYFIKLGLPKTFYQLSVEPIPNFELINFIDYIQFESKDARVYDLANEELIFDHDFIRFSLNWDKAKYYHSWDELSKDIPSSYSIDMQLAIGEVAPNRAIIAPLSLVYLSLPPINNANINLVTNLSTSKPNPIPVDLLSNFKLEVKTLDIDGKDASGKIKFDAEVQRVEENEDGIFSFESDLKIKNLRNLLKYIELIDKKAPELEILKNQYLTQVLEQSYNVKTSASGKYKISPKINKLTLDNLDFMLDDIGFGLKADTALSQDQQWHFNGSLLLLKPDSLLRKIANMAAIYTKADMGIRERQVNDMVSVLKAISNHPKSESRDVSIDFSFSNDINSSKIGTIPLKFFKNLDTFKQFFEKDNIK